MEDINCEGFTFYNNFDSANLAKVSFVPPIEAPAAVIIINNNGSGGGGKTHPTVDVPDVEFNIWTKPDCCGTVYENGNRTWFYFGIKSPDPGVLVRLNMIDLNRQGKMYSQGMAPVYRVIPGKMQWERIRDKPSYSIIDDTFTLTFKFKTPENVQSVVYFAFTYPFSYADLQKMLTNIETRFSNFIPTTEDDVYYHREVVCRSLEGREVTLITISSHHGMTVEREDRLDNLFPDRNKARPNKFVGKKVVFVSARVHPGETPSSFVFNGLLNLLLTREDAVASALRKLYVFKLIPFLNPDGVACGHYRTDTRGVNLNRVYLNPSPTHHPSVYAARALIRYHHHDYRQVAEIADVDEEEECGECAVLRRRVAESKGGGQVISARVSNMTLEEEEEEEEGKNGNLCCKRCREGKANGEVKSDEETTTVQGGDSNEIESGLFLYMDCHGHASKKGIFMYGNHFQDLNRNVECMLLPKLMSLNNHNFHFTACNFTERNMYLKDRRDGMSREGSGRVAVLKLTGLTRSYTLECNYNTGRIVNVLPPTAKENHLKTSSILVPPKYNPQVFEEAGRSLGASILDLTGRNPCTRLSHSEFHSLSGLREWLRTNCANCSDETTATSKIKLRNLSGGHHHHHQARPSSTNKPRPLKPVQPKRSTNKTSAAVSMNLTGRPAAGTVLLPFDDGSTTKSKPKNPSVVLSSSQPSCSYASVDRRHQRFKTAGGRIVRTKPNNNNKLKGTTANFNLHGAADTVATAKVQKNKVRIGSGAVNNKSKLRLACCRSVKSGGDEGWKSRSVSNLATSSSSSIVDAVETNSGLYRIQSFAKNSLTHIKYNKKHRRLMMTAAVADSGNVEKGVSGKKKNKFKSK